MQKTADADKVNLRRRRFAGATAMMLAAAEFGVGRHAMAQASMASGTALPAIKPGTNTSLGPPRQIDAGLLNIGYVEMGPQKGSPVILLHGWPYDIHSY